VKLSFVVPAYNEERLLSATLDAIRAAATDVAVPYEIIVADDASTDRTAEIAASHGAQVVSVAHRQIAATRNSGAKIATGDVLIFVDADTLIDAAVVRGTLDAIAQGAIGGGASIRFEGAMPRYAKLLVPLFARAYRAAGLAAGCYVFCRRDAFDAIGGFDEQYFGAEEVVLSRALKRRGKFVVLGNPVLTSGRKMRTYSGKELLQSLAHFARRGPNDVKQREGMEMWYGERRHDPQDRA
jgi:glycosyltransferase involved in cell wall biosynthesis